MPLRTAQLLLSEAKIGSANHQYAQTWRQHSVAKYGPLQPEYVLAP